MNKRKNLGVFALSALTILSLASCGGNNPTSSSSEIPSSESEAPSSSSVTPLPSSSNGNKITATIAHNTIPSGATFFDGCMPTVIYHDEAAGTDVDVYDQAFRTTYDIKDKDGKKYEASDPLPAGDYTCNVIFNKTRYYTASVSFKVTEATPTKTTFGTDGTPLPGMGVKTYDAGYMEDYDYLSYSGMDVLGGKGMPSRGNVNILVVPVQFTNVSFDNSQVEGTHTVQDVLEEAFFGTSEDTPWESLASYYEKASYGKLHIGGTVTNTYTAPFADTSVSKNDSSWVRSLIPNIVTWLKTPEGGSLNMADYDANDDGRIDGIEIVYTTTIPVEYDSQTGESLAGAFWNYTFNLSGSSMASPTAGRVFWSRWDFVCNSYYVDSPKGLKVTRGTSINKVDAHTIIHETGHMMGVNDYYSYDKTESPAGCVDMMDQNVGDHNPYSKMGLGWVEPWVVDGSKNNFEITIPSFTETGKFLLLRDTVVDPYNDTPYDEYLILSFYTPTGVNEEDSDGYPEWKNSIGSTGESTHGHAGTYDHPGLQVFHVDTRPASSVTVDGKQVYGYAEHPKATPTSTETAAKRVHDNTPSRSANLTDEEGSPYSEFAIVPASGLNSFMGSSAYSAMGYMANLFGTSQYLNVDLGVEKSDDRGGSNTKYGGSVYTNYKMRSLYNHDLFFNDNTKLTWSFEVSSMSTNGTKEDYTDDTCTIHFINNAANA